MQKLDMIQALLKAGITGNKCDVTVCPASLDVNSDLSKLTGGKNTTNTNWGINADGSCFATMNTYNGGLLCSPGNTDPECVKLAGDGQTPGQAASETPFKYSLDAISANWPIHVAMYTDFLAYQVEWVPGKDGYIRWMLERQPLFEIPAAAVTTPPQDTANSNPTKILPEEPMYLITNVALSSTWTAEPPNAPRACKDHGNITDTDTKGLSELICDQFPLDMKIDYVRVYQDVSPSSTMNIGCDTASHPTRKSIASHIKEYSNDANPIADVAGKAFCVTDADCSINEFKTGECMSKRCSCSTTKYMGPRCTLPVANLTAPPINPANGGSGGTGGNTDTKTPSSTDPAKKSGASALATSGVAVAMASLLAFF